MWTFTLPPVTCPLSVLSDDLTNWFYDPSLNELKVRLQAAKTAQEEPRLRDPQRWSKTTAQFSISLALRDTLATVYHLPHCTNAALKALELFHAFDLFDTKTAGAVTGTDTAPPFVYFDNAALPGSFVLMAHYYNTIIAGRQSRQHQWYANSLVLPPSPETAALGDVYGLVAAFPDRWLMNSPPANKGDVTTPGLQEAVSRKLRGQAHLCTSDLGFEAHDPNRQEEEHALAHIGQVLAGLVALRPGGHLLVKQFTFFEPLTISLLAMLRGCFDALTLAKPLASKPDNSEIYVVCRGFLPDAFAAAGVERHLLARLTDLRSSHTPLLGSAAIGRPFLDAIVKAAQQLVDRQCSSLAATIETFELVSRPRTGVRLRQTALWQATEALARQWQVRNAFLVEYPEDMHLQPQRTGASPSGGPHRKRRAGVSPGSGPQARAPKYEGPVECGIGAYLNKVRTTLLQQYVRKGNVVVDVGIGVQAPDLEAYRDIRVKQILAIDKSVDVATALNERLQRWVNMGQRTNVVCADYVHSTDLLVALREATGATLHDAPIADAVVAQFALPAVVSTSAECDEFFRRSHELLRPKRRLLGIHLDADRLLQLGQSTDLRSVRFETPMLSAVYTAGPPPQAAAQSSTGGLPGASGLGSAYGRIKLELDKADKLDNLAGDYSALTRDTLVRTAERTGFDLELYQSVRDYALHRQLSWSLSSAEQEWATLFVVFVFVRR
jgi:hypothetical protein